MYDYAMARCDAAPHWRLPKLWFTHFFSALPINTQVFQAVFEGKPEAFCVLLFGYGTCYYHFAASYKQHYGASHLMVKTAMEWSKAQGHKRFHLGSGLEKQDGLFTFKSGFSKLRAPVYKYEIKGDGACMQQL
jgi:hypothetical protein